MTLEELKELLEEQEIANVISILDSMGYLVQKKKILPTIPEANRVLGKAGFARTDGVPLAGIRIFIQPVEQNLSVVDDAGNAIHIGSVLSPTVYTTGADGTVEIPFVKGVVFRFHTSLSHRSRELRVPDQDFNLFDPNIEISTDAFTTAAPSYKSPIRRDI